MPVSGQHRLMLVRADLDRIRNVANGIVTLTGQPNTPDERELIPVAIRLTWDIDGVVDVVNKIGTAVN